MNRPRWIAMSLPALVMVLLSGCHGVRKAAEFGRAEPVRAVWVTRWDYKTPQDVAAVLENCKRAGFNTILWQARGAGTALYRSRIEPWSPEFEGKDPGFDPLALACSEAHKRGLTLHAWVNVMPAWHGNKLPTDRRQLLNAHPDWFLRDAQNRPQPMGWYLSLNPCYPEVRDYLVGVCHEIVARYPVDGLHLDYIRFPNDYHKGYDAMGGVPDYPRDSRTLAMFRRATGKSPDDDAIAWRNWRATQVNVLMKRLRDMVDRTKRGVALTAAVGADPDRAFNGHYQDARKWITQGWVDGVFTMNYASAMGEFEGRFAKWQPWMAQRPVATGIMFDQRDPLLVQGQVTSAVRHGTHFAAFAYNSMFERRDASGRPAMDAQSPSRQQIRQGVLPLVQNLAAAEKKSPQASALAGSR